MANLPTSRGGEHGSQATCRNSTLSNPVWEGIRRLAAFVVMWFVTLGLPLIYERRLATLEQSPGEPLALDQIPAQEAERSGRADTQLFGESNLSEIQKGQRLIKRCMLEWRACVMLSTVNLSLIGSMFSVMPDPCTSRILLYLAFVVALSALIIAVIHLVHFEHVHDSQESTLYLSMVRRSKRISLDSFLALPILWSTWALLLSSTSLLLYLWTSTAEPGNSSSSPQGVDTSQLSEYMTPHFWSRFLPTAAFLISVWNIWSIFVVISGPLDAKSQAIFSLAQVELPRPAGMTTLSEQ